MGEYQTSQSVIDSFLGEKRIALAGASRSGKKFGNSVLKMLFDNGYEVFPVHPEAETIDGFHCYSDVASLPNDIGACLLVVPPAVSERLIPQLAEKGIRKVWMQQGAESATALELTAERNMEAVAGECIFMFAEPVKGGHKFHRWLWGLFGKLPKD